MDQLRPDVVVASLALCVGSAAIISEIAWRDVLTRRGRVIVPVALGVVAWLINMALNLLVITLL